MQINWPNRLSILRILLSPLFMVLLIDNRQGSRIAALAVFFIASVTDLYDGYLARRYGWVTNLGKFLDPLADKLLIALALIGLNQIDLVPGWTLYLIIGRELLVTGLRSIAAYAGVLIMPSRMGKYKTSTQMLSMFLYLLYSVLEHDSTGRTAFLYRSGMELASGRSILLFSADIILVIAVLLAVISGVDYFWRNRSIIRRLVL
ncbi:MAG: CDP-diacylglycerol--glycerol-3-phosphate 3-phosphatidyltransferase [Candidatus Fermentibacteraceae bacterium]|nr:CDP-diacylglycerol--glycerol-3-phosphate 3-phosphatidyltransferase [Candidatus Fermentibacteraceae bacterium]MBN2607790.1 CDP-diacylglycerol--glycerol-3-phosphate 3-phosphatidyltransferase [Candidatus Fermentibacteraceae bacterium]